MGCGEMPAAEFEAFLRTTLGHAARHSDDGSIHFVCMHWGKIRELLAAAADLFSETKNLCVWSKTNAGMGSLYRSRHELIFVFKKGDAPHINNVELGRFGRNRTNVWDYPGQNVLSEEQAAEDQAILDAYAAEVLSRALSASAMRLGATDDNGPNVDG
jgi:hypothetical protein